MKVISPRDPTGDTWIRRTVLPGGGIKLSASTRRVQSSEQREPGRIITMAWGDRYIHDMLSVTIPALLAPGNIPAFVEHFDCDFVIVTEARLFDLIANSPVATHLLDYCDIRLLPIDDLLSSWYGITLTYALVRGFADLGPEMVNTHLVFLNADFITADGSYRKLAEMIRRGERLVVSPSYCMVLEETIDALRGRYDYSTCALSISPREMAAMILAHRHNTIRAKTVNQQLFRIHRYDQFYWYVDERTMLARQMPIAVVYFRPERVLTEMPTFWDYGVISEYCPTSKPCVLGDSDDFLLGELRTRGTFHDLLHMGWPDIEEIASDLSSFTVKDHRDYGRYRLTLHSGDLPPDIESHEAQLTQFVDAVYGRLSAPINYRNHPFWTAAFPHFWEAHNSSRAAIQEQARLEEEIRRQPEHAGRQRQLDLVNEHLRETRIELYSSDARSQAERGELRAKIARLEAAYRKEREQVEAQLTQIDERRRGLLETIRSLESEAGDLRAPVEEALRARKRPSQQTVWSPRGRLISDLSRLYRAVFGQIPQTTPWHAYHAVFGVAKAILETNEVQNCRRVLVIASANDVGSLLAKSISAPKIVVTPEMVRLGLYENLLQRGDRFDLCFFALAFEDIRNFRALLDTLRPQLRPASRVILFHQNSALRSLDDSTYEFTQSVFPLIGRSRVVFSGSLLSAWALRLFNCGLKLNPNTVSGVLGMVVMLGVSAPLSWLAVLREKKRRSTRLPRHCTSLTIDIQL